MVLVAFLSADISISPVLASQNIKPQEAGENEVASAVGRELQKHGDIVIGSSVGVAFEQLVSDTILTDIGLLRSCGDVACRSNPLRCNKLRQRQNEIQKGKNINGVVVTH